MAESLLINNNQTLSKYVQVGRFGMALQGAKKVGVAGIVNKRMVNLTFSVFMDGNFKQFIK